MEGNKKIERILEIALNEELEKYEKIVKKLNKKLPLFNGSKRIAAAVLKEYLGEQVVSDFSFDIKKRETKKSFNKKEDDKQKKVIFEDIKNGRVRFFVNIGRNKKISAGNLIKEIVNYSKIDGKLIGRIDIHFNYSFFEVPEDLAEKVYLSLKGAKINGEVVNVEPAKKKRAF